MNGKLTPVLFCLTQSTLIQFQTLLFILNTLLELQHELIKLLSLMQDWQGHGWTLESWTEGVSDPNMEDVVVVVHRVIEVMTVFAESKRDQDMDVL